MADRSRVMRFVAAPAALALYLGLALVLFHAAWRDPQRMTIGSGTDAIFSIWDLRWVPFAIGHGLNPLLTDYLDYPTGANLMWSGLFPLPAMILSPVTNAFGPVVAYNVMATLALAGSAWAAYFAIRRYVTSPIAAFCGGLLYGFSPALIAQSLGHPQIAIAIVPPLMLLLLDEIVIRQRWESWRSGGLLGVLGAIQLLTGEEMLAAEVVVALAALILLAALHRDAIRSRMPYVIRAAAFAAGTFGLLAAGPIAIQFLGPERVNGSLQPANLYVSDLLNFIVPTSVQQFSPRLAQAVSEQFSGNLAEWNAFLGIPLIAVLVYAVTKGRHLPVVRLSAAMVVLLALLSLGVTLHLAGLTTPIPVGLMGLVFPALRPVFPSRPLTYAFVGLWASLAVVPLVSNILPARLMVFSFLFAGVLLAVLIDQLLATPGRRRWIALAAVGFAMLSIAPKVPFPAGGSETPAFFSSLPNSAIPSGRVVLVAPYARAGSSEAMLWQAASGMAFRMPEGYALLPGPRGSPPDSALGSEMAAVELGAAPDLSPQSLARMASDLRRWQVEAVVVGPMPHRPAMVALFSALFQASPLTAGGVDFWPPAAIAGVAASPTQ